MSEEKQASWKKIIGIPAFMGLVLGFVAALTQALLISAGGPEAYAFCVACHTRDMTNWFVNLFGGVAVAGMDGSPIVGLAPFSLFITVFTPVGLLLGAYFSARKSKEFKVKKSTPVIYVLYILGGIAVMIFALLLGACPYRAALRTGYGDWVALIGIFGIIGGVAAGAMIVLWRMKKMEAV